MQFINSVPFYNFMKRESLLVSVVIPMYNVENYIKKCASSLFEQSLSNIEYIFVNDASTDSTVLILEKILDLYPNRKNQTKIISHSTNRGSVVSRHTGLQSSSGKYILFCDSDDWVSPEMLLRLLMEAEGGQYDIVYCNYLVVSHGENRICVQTVYSSKIAYIQAIIAGELGGYLWNKLVKRELYERVVFSMGYDMWEDLYISIQLFCYAEAVGSVNAALYYYNQENLNSIVHSCSPKRLYAMVENVRLIESFLTSYNIEMKTYLESRKMYCKNLMIVQNVAVQKWNMIFKEVNLLFCRNQNIPFYIRMIAYGLNHNVFIGYNIYLLIKRLIRHIRYSVMILTDHRST